MQVDPELRRDVRDRGGVHVSVIANVQHESVESMRTDTRQERGVEHGATDEAVAPALCKASRTNTRSWSNTSDPLYAAGS